jgi:acetyl esterase/lipase
MKHVLSLLALLLAWPDVRADEPKQLLNVPYGTHPRQVLDFYQAKSDQPTPVVFYIHGGGWRNGDKKINPKAFLVQGQKRSCLSAAASE